MKKTVRLLELDCAHCAAEIERAVRGIKGIDSASVNFFTRRMTIDTSESDFEQLFDTIVKTVHKIEPDVRVCL